LPKQSSLVDMLMVRVPFICHVKRAQGLISFRTCLQCDKNKRRRRADNSAQGGAERNPGDNDPKKRHKSPVKGGTFLTAQNCQTLTTLGQKPIPIIN